MDNYYIYASFSNINEVINHLVNHLDCKINVGLS